MIRDYRAVRAVASAIAEAADEIIDAYRERRVVYEPNITERLIGAIEKGERINDAGERVSLAFRWRDPDAA